MVLPGALEHLAQGMFAMVADIEMIKAIVDLFALAS